MKRLIFVIVIVLGFGCNQTIDRKTQVLDSLKRVYADKEIHITLNNNQSGTNPLTSKYAYIDKEKSDLAFELQTWNKYKVDSEEGLTFVSTQEHPYEEPSDMVLIETIGNVAKKRGYVSYKYIKEFNEASYYVNK